MQWKEGETEPKSWFDFYRSNPCIPVDYSSIHTALVIALETPASPRARSASPKTQIRSVRILLRPGYHYLKHAVDIRAMPGVVVTFQTMETPTNIYRPPPKPTTDEVAAENASPEKPTSASKKGHRALRSLMLCYRPEVADESDTEAATDHVAPDFSDPMRPLPNHATLILRSRRHNEPVFRVHQGLLNLDNIEIQHTSHGTDIWNGNAAVQIQPPMSENDRPISVNPRPTAILNRVQISSKTGRGIVNIDGGYLSVRNSMVRDCAATGVYIGGPGSEAIIECTDVIRNGVGNRTGRRGVARGHSGIYLEQGVTKILDSNVSNNSLTGISVVSTDNAFITLEDSDLMLNGTHQLELPQLGSVARQSSVVANNNMAPQGEPRLRSGLIISEPSPPVPPLVTLHDFVRIYPSN